MLTLTINGNTVTASPDKTILAVCHEQGIDTIPTLCYDEKLPPFGSCFLCVVEVEGQNRLFPACSTKVAEGMVIQTRSERVSRARKTCLELLLSDHYADCFGPCRLACPADIDIQGYMSLISFGKFTEAIELIKEKNPLPSVCGRVCTRKCELNCRRNLIDEPVGIDFLKRYASDLDMAGDMWTPDVKPRNGKRVAVIGGGPAGVTCAYYLVREGYEPTIYEALPEMGGMLRYGIPEYRLPKAVLDKEIGWVTKLGVDVHVNQRLGVDFQMDDLFTQGYQSVFVALGAQVGKPMQVENENVPGVLSGVEFLKQVTMGSAPPVKGRVVVVGGGNTAIDAARTSLRLGADEVVLLYRRTRKEMPANMVEIVAAEEEGVRMEFLQAPTRVNVENDRVVSVECITMELGEPDASGRRRPVELKGSEHDFPCDWVISAIGQEADLTGVHNDAGIKITKWKTIEAAKGTFHTERPGVFSGGDVVTGPADAIDAIAAGKMAADAIMLYLETGVVTPLTKRFESKRDNFQKLTEKDLPPIEKSGRHHAHERPAGERKNDFHEVEMAYDTTSAIEEALRCAECGCDAGLACRLQDYCTEYGVQQERFVGEFNKYKVDSRHPFIKIDSNKCIRCGRCVNTCAEILNVAALGFVNRGFRTIVKPAMEKALHETNCVSCGNCIDVCPTGALVELMPFRRQGPWDMEAVPNVCNYCSVGCTLSLQVKTSDLFYVTGAAPDAEPNHGELCVKGRFGYQHYLDGSRATRPMVKKGGRLVEASWDEALEAAEKGMKKVIEDHSADHILVAASPKLSNEELYLAGKFARVAIGTNTIASFHHLASEADYHALDDMLGATVSTVDADEVRDADLYIFLGGNPTGENPVLGWQVKRRIKHGAEAIVINSAKIDLVPFAGAWADPRRGTATVLLNGVIAELLRRGAADQAFIDGRTAHFDAFQAHVLKNDIGDVSSVTGVSEAVILKIADMLSDPKKKIVAWYNIDSRIDRVSSDLRALATLLMVLGRIGVPGSGLALLSGQANHTGMTLAGFDSKLLPGGAPMHAGPVADAVQALWNTDVRALAAASGSNLARKMREDKVRAAFIFGENPIVSSEYNAFVQNLEFVVVGDMFLTETAQAADVFLPLSGYLETKGHLTNWCGMRQESTPIGEPLSGRHTLDLIADLAHRMGGSDGYGSAEDTHRELEGIIALHGMNGLLRGAFKTADGKANFIVYSDQVLPTNAATANVLEIDARVTDRIKQIKA
ncbi:MAG: molybdopterin-dependent oxidoreductase [Ignavibacteria bacterium]|nr:molybdopterin-dependent oxidoreductase [Ignavibacteria bacterium]